MVGYMASRRIAYRKKNQNRIAMVMVTCIVIVLTIVVGIQSMTLYKKLKINMEQISVLEEQIAEQEKRSEELIEFEAYTHTKKYAEEIAKKKWDYVKDDEIIYREEDSE